MLRMMVAKCLRQRAMSSCLVSCTTAARRAIRSGIRWCWAASGMGRGARVLLAALPRCVNATMRLRTSRLAYTCSFLGVVDMLGSSFTDNTVATGFGLHLAQPILRKEWTESMTVVEGKKLLEECMKVLYYRDGRTINRVSQTRPTCVSPCISLRFKSLKLPLCCALCRCKSAQLRPPAARSRSRTSWKPSGITQDSLTRGATPPAPGKRS